jgi:hypothetical protein
MRNEKKFLRRAFLASWLVGAPALTGWAIEDAGVSNPLSGAFDPRAAGLAGAVVAAPEDPSILGHNPAALAEGKRSRLIAAHAPGGLPSPENFLDGSVDMAGLEWPTLEHGSLGLLILSTSAADIGLRDSAGLSLGTGSYGQSSILVGWGLNVGKGLNLGLAANFLNQSLANQSAEGAGLNLGALWHVREGTAWLSSLPEGLRLGLSAENLVAPELKLGSGQADRYPPVWHLGLSWLGGLGDWQEGAYGEMDKDEAQSWKAAAGLELGFRGIATARGGWGSQGPALGLGLSYASLNLDWAASASDLGWLQRLGLAWHFGGDLASRRHQSQTDHERLLEEQARLKAESLLAAERVQEEALKRQVEAGRREVEERRKTLERREAEWQEEVKRSHLPPGPASATVLSGSSMDWYRKGSTAFLLGDYKNAIDCWNKVLALHPGHPLALRNIQEAEQRLAGSTPSPKGP